MTEVSFHKGSSASVEVHLHPHLAPLESKMLPDGHKEFQERLVAVHGPPLKALRDLASPHGSSISNLTRDELLLQAYCVPQAGQAARQKEHRFELLQGGCSIEVIDVPSLAIFEVTGQSSQQIEQATLHVQYSEHHSDALQREQQTHANLTHQHQTHVQNDRQHLCASQQEDVSSPLNDADTDSRETHRHGKERISEASPVDTPQPSISCEESKHTQSALPESRHATNTRHAERQGTGQSLTAMEQLLASLPDIDIIASPAQLQRSHDNMAQHPPPTRQGDSVQEHLPDQAQQIHASREVCRSDQEQPHSALHEDATGQGENSGNQANHSNTSEITSEPASFLYAQPTQKQLRKQKRKGVLVPQVDSAVQACRISISPGIAAVQPSPGSLGLDAIVSATEGLLQAPHTASTSRPALTARAKAQSAQPAYTSRPHPTQKAVAPTHKPSKPPTHFIADLQLDLAARVLAKQPDLAQMEQLSSMQQRGLSYSNMLLSGQQHRSFSPTGAPRLARHAAEQQAFSPGISLQTAAGAALKAGSASHLFTYVSPTEQPCTADPHASWRSRVADSAAGAPLTASLPAFDVGSIQSHVAAGGQSPIMARAGQPPLDLHALICAMVASEHTAAALEQQLAASSQRAACIPGKATGSMLSLLTGRQDVPMQTVPGIPMSLQDSWPEGDPIAQNQLVAKYIDAGTIIQGYPISIPTLDEQQTAQWAAPAMQGASVQQEYELLPVMRSPAGAGTAFGSPTPLTLSGSLPATPLAEDASLSRLWHTAAKKRVRSSSSERPAKSPRLDSLGTGTPGVGVVGFPSPWKTASPAPLMSTPSARLSRATEYLHGVSPEGPSVPQPSYVQSRGQPVAPTSHSADRAHGRRSASPRQRAKQQISWLQAQCRDVAPDLELLELQQISQQLHSLLSQCGGSIQPSEQGFGHMSRSLLKILEHLLVFPMTTLLLKDAHIITPVYACSKYPQEDVAGFAGYLLSQWQSLLTSSLYPQDTGSPAAASAGFSAAVSASPDMAQADMSAAGPGNGGTPTAHARQQQQWQKHQLAVHLQSAQQPQPRVGQQTPEPQGFRPYSSGQAGSAAPQPEQMEIMQAAAQGTVSPSALSLLESRSAADLSQAAHAAAGGVTMPSSSKKADAIRSHSRAWDGDMGAMPGVQSTGAQANQPIQGFEPLQQLQSLPGNGPNVSVLHAFDGAFLRQVQTAPTPQPASTALRSPTHPPELEEQAQGMTQEEIHALFPSLLQEQDWHIPGMMAPYLTGMGAPQQHGRSHPNDQGMDGGGPGMHGGGSRSGLSALTGASSAFVPFKQRASNMRLQHPEHPDKQPCPGGNCMRPPGGRVQRPQGSSNESMCEGDHCQPHGTSMGEHNCQGMAGEALPAKRGSQSGPHCLLGQRSAGPPAAPSSNASGVDVSILEGQSAPPQGFVAPGRAAEAACSPQGAALSEEETVISDIPQRTGRRPRTVAALAPRKRTAPKKAAPRTAHPAAAASGMKAGERCRGGGRAERVKRRAMLLEERAARSRQAAERSAADSLPHQGSSGLDGSQGAAWGLATMLQKGSRARRQLSRAAPSSRQVLREVAGTLGDVIDAVEAAAASELPEHSEALDQATQGKGPTSEDHPDAAAKAEKTPSADSEAARGGAGSEVPDKAGNSIRVVWTKEDEDLYKEVLRTHGRSMVHLCAAFPNKPSKAITKFFNNRKKVAGLADILTNAGHSFEIV